MTAPLHQTIPLERIKPSPTNPRKRFDEASLRELAESIRSKGVLQPLLVRPAGRWFVIDQGPVCYAAVPRAAGFGHNLHHTFTGEKAKDLAAAKVAELNGEAGFELVAGERRYRASQLAGLAEVPCVVRELTDREVLEVQVVENEQRQDVTPMERADGYAALVERHRVTVEDLAQRVGKSPATIRGLLKLRQLPAAARKAVEDGTLPAATAGLIARLPGEKDREELAKQVLEPSWDGSQLSYRQVKGIIEREYMVELKGCSFSRKSPTLVPGAGSCDDCPHRAGNLQKAEPEAWAGLRADVCTLPGCFRQKVEAHAKQAAAAAKAKGRTVLSAREAEAVFDQYTPGRLRYNAAYYDLASQCWDDTEPKKRTYKQLVGSELASQVVVAIDAAGRSHELVPKAAADKVLRDKGVRGPAGRPAGDDEWRKKHEHERRVKLETIRRAGAAVADAAQVVITVGADLRRPPAELGPDVLQLFRHLARHVIDRAWADVLREVARRRGMLKKGHGPMVDVFADLVLQGDPAVLLGLALEIAAGHHLLFGTRREDGSFWASFGVDPKKIEKAADAELKGQAKEKGRKPAGKKAKAVAVTTSGHEEEEE